MSLKDNNSETPHDGLTIPLTSQQKGRFQIIKRHAQGGLGVVSVALDAEINREVAFKEILDTYADDLGCRDRFVLEAELTGRLEHPGIVPIYSLGKHANGRPYYAMRFIHGENLRSAAKKFHEEVFESPLDRRLALRRLVERFVDVCDVMEFAHARGVVHRDLKPDNIMLGKYGETLVVDWGLAKLMAHGHRADESAELTLPPTANVQGSGTALGAKVGSPAYMSPEQADGRTGELGPATDIFGLGATFYHMLTGTAPFAGETWREVLERAKASDFTPPSDTKPGVPLPLSEICMKAMAARSEDRYPNVADLRYAVQSWLDDEPLAELSAAVGWIEELHSAHPDRVEYQARLGRELSVRSKVLQSLQRFEESLNDCRRAVELLEAVFRRHLGDIHRYQELFYARTQLTSVHRALGQMEEAQQIEDETKVRFRQLVDATPRSAELREHLMSVTMTQGFSIAEAEKLIDEHLQGASATPDWDDKNQGLPSTLQLDLDNPFAFTDESVAQQRYTVLSVLGRGGLGTVYKAQDKLLGREVALKSLPDDRVTRHPNLLRAAVIQGAFMHPNIVPVFDVAFQKQYRLPFVTMPIITGRSWEAIFRELPDARQERNRWWRRHLQEFIEICGAVHYAHQRGVLHRDLKPDNVLVDDDGRSWLLDWGISHIYEPAKFPHIDRNDIRELVLDRERQGQIIGTPAYMAPEQGRGVGLTVRTDVYSLGACMFQLLTGEVARKFNSMGDALARITSEPPPQPRQLNPRVPQSLNSICAKAMAFNASDRYETAQELGQAVQAWLSGPMRKLFG